MTILTFDEAFLCLASLDRLLILLLPIREMQVSRSGFEREVEESARRFMDNAKELQKYFLCLPHVHPLNKKEQLKKEIEALEHELVAKDAVVEKCAKLIAVWQVEQEKLLTQVHGTMDRA
eukprot:TRINITY_DN23408_c0_g1_i1.p1 TRINITY_DN23408_c0_g1~~TRINITY_DN23408_c0_g1_i1.p1  ORF type:complete len:120 (+),score=22.03 TRINITY_DN23408_c0_g1_i1:586-945(+)